MENRPASQPWTRNPEAWDDLFDAFRRDIAPKRDIAFAIIDHLTEDDAPMVVKRCPSGLLVELQHLVESSPADHDDESWSTFSIIFGGTWTLTKEEIEKANAETNRRFREGIRIFRKALGTLGRPSH